MFADGRKQAVAFEGREDEIVRAERDPQPLRVLGEDAAHDDEVSGALVDAFVGPTDGLVELVEDPMHVCPRIDTFRHTHPDLWAKKSPGAFAPGLG